MPAPTACSSPQGEKPEGIQEQDQIAASPADDEHSGLSAAASPGSTGASDAETGGAVSPLTAVDALPLTTPAEAGDVADRAGEVADGMEHFQRLRRRMLVSTLLASLTAVPVCWLLFDLPAALSLLVGAVAGLLYLVLLARSVARLGGDRRSVGKIQLLVPIVLVLSSARIPALELVPALVGFLLYKPALLVQAYLDR